MSPIQLVAQDAGGRCPPYSPSIKQEAGWSLPRISHRRESVQVHECHFRNGCQRLGGPEKGPEKSTSPVLAGEGQAGMAPLVHARPG